MNYPRILHGVLHFLVFENRYYFEFAFIRNSSVIFQCRCATHARFRLPSRTEPVLGPWQTVSITDEGLTSPRIFFSFRLLLEGAIAICCFPRCSHCLPPPCSHGLETFPQRRLRQCDVRWGQIQQRDSVFSYWTACRFFTCCSHNCYRWNWSVMYLTWTFNIF